MKRPLPTKKQSNPKDVITTRLITSDADEPLYKYNFSVLEKQKLISGGEAKALLSLLLRFKKEGKWKPVPQSDFNYIDELIKKVNDVCQ